MLCKIHFISLCFFFINNMCLELVNEHARNVHPLLLLLAQLFRECVLKQSSGSQPFERSHRALIRLPG